MNLEGQSLHHSFPRAGPSMGLKVQFAFHVQSMHKHQGTELRALKSALQQRESRIELLENQGKQENLEAAATVAAFERQIATLKGGSFSWP